MNNAHAFGRVINSTHEVIHVMNNEPLRNYYTALIVL